MKQKNGGIKRLLEFTGEKRSLLNISRILSGVSAIFILGPFLCVYFAARELVNVFTGSALDTQSLVRWGMIALVLELIGLALYFCALLGILTGYIMCTSMCCVSIFIKITFKNN